MGKVNVKLLSVITCLVIFSLVIGMVGCSSTSAPASTTSVPKGETKVLKYGLIIPMTGPTAAYGRDALRSHELAADAIKSRGGIKVGNDSYIIELVSYDSQADLTPCYSPLHTKVFSVL